MPYGSAKWIANRTQFMSSFVPLAVTGGEGGRGNDNLEKFTHFRAIPAPEVIVAGTNCAPLCHTNRSYPRVSRLRNEPKISENGQKKAGAPGEI